MPCVSCVVRPTQFHSRGSAEPRTRMCIDSTRDTWKQPRVGFVQSRGNTNYEFTEVAADLERRRDHSSPCTRNRRVRKKKDESPGRRVHRRNTNTIVVASSSSPRPFPGEFLPRFPLTPFIRGNTHECRWVDVYLFETRITTLRSEAKSVEYLGRKGKSAGKRFIKIE